MLTRAVRFVLRSRVSDVQLTCFDRKALLAIEASNGLPAGPHGDVTSLEMFQFNFPQVRGGAVVALLGSDRSAATDPLPGRLPGSAQPVRGAADAGAHLRAGGMPWA